MVFTVLPVFCMFAQGANIVASGYCGGEDDGTNLAWTLDNEGALTITGEGSMENYTVSALPISCSSPWYNDSRVKRVIVSSGVTTVSQAAFLNCT